MERSSQSDEIAQFHSLFDLISDGIVVVQDGKIARVNRRFVDMIGAKREDLIGVQFQDLLESSTHEEYDAHAKGLTSEKTLEPCFVGVIDFGGSRVKVELSFVQGASKDKTTHIIVVKDLTERIQLQEAADASESKYTQLFHTSPTAIFILSQRGIIQEVNGAVQRILGFNAAELIKRNISSFMEEEEIGRQILDEVHQGKLPSGIEIRMRKADGKSIWMSATVQMVDTSSQSKIAFMAVDIDRRKAAEHRERLERERASLMLEIMTHDLSNVNQGILFALGLLEASFELPAAAERVLSETTWNVRRASRMIANLRAIIQLRETPLQIEGVDIHAFCASAIERVQGDFPWKKLIVKSNLGEGIVPIAGNPLIEHIAFNILHNSMMHDEREEVIVEIVGSIEELEGAFRLEFSDRGPGIPDNLKEWVFKRTGSPDAQKVGRGLGLTLVDSIVSRIGGRIWVEDRVTGDHTQGAKFVVMLPLWEETKELTCGRVACIYFYRSDHCLFCQPTLEILRGIMDEIGIDQSHLHIINTDDPRSEVEESELPGLPFIRICDIELTGFVGEDAVRTSLMNFLIKPCFPY